MREPEAPAPGGAWLGGAAVYERHRRDCTDQANAAQERGDGAKAEHFRELAAQWRRWRDHEQSEMRRRALNRRVHRRY